MLCVNCGTKLPDGANFCPSCGAKTPLQAEPEISIQNQAVPIVEPITNTSATPEGEAIKFIIHGEGFSIDGSYRNYTTERNRFFKKYDDYMRKLFPAQFAAFKKCIESDQDRCIKILSELGTSVINWGLDEGVNFLIEHGVFDISKKTLAHECAETLARGFNVAYNQFEEGYLSIVATAEQMEEYRKLMHNSRGRWRGGGFGVSSAVKGAAVAGALNLGGTVLSGIGNAMTGAIDNNTIRNQKINFLRKRDWYGYCFSVLLSDISILFEKAYYLLTVNSDYIMPPLNLKKSEIYYENIEKASNAQQAIVFNLMALTEYPYHRGVYKKLSASQPFLDMDVIKLVEYLQPELLWKELYPIHYKLHIQKEYERFPKEDDAQIDEKIAFWQDKIDTIAQREQQSKFVEAFSNLYLKELEKSCEELKKRKKEIERSVQLQKSLEVSFSKISIIRKPIDDAISIGNLSYVWEQIDKGNTYAEYALSGYYDAICENCIEKYDVDKMLRLIKDVIDKAGQGNTFAKYIYMDLLYSIYVRDRRDAAKATEAAKSILQLADTGNISAIARKGFWGKMGYYNATPTPVDAIPFLEKAANQHHPTGLTQLGICYKNGECGLPVDKEKAKYYLEIASAYGQPWAKKELNKMIESSTSANNSSGCFITSAVCTYLQKPDDCYELTAFRDFRDNWLKKQPDGKSLIEEYYRIAPAIVRKIEVSGERDRIYKRIWTQYLLPCLTYIEKGEFLKCKETYSSMVNNIRFDLTSR